MSDLHVNARGTLYREGSPPTDCKVLEYKAGRDSGDHLLEFPNGGGDGKTGVVTREWYVMRSKGSHENGTFELK